jgi:hypothetical protein
VSTALVPTPWVPPSRCPECGTINDGATLAYEIGHRRPAAGDAGICIVCRHISVYNADLTQREPTIDEMLKFGRDPKIRLMLWLIAKSKK